MTQRLLPTVIALLMASVASAQPADGIRIATWNVTLYEGGFLDEIGTVVYGSFEGRQLDPDAIVVQEFQTRRSYDDFLVALNRAPGSRGDWSASEYRDGTGFDTHLFYRTSQLELLEATVVSVGGPAPNHPRDPMRYEVRPVGYDSPSTVLSIYSVHFKAGSTPSDRARRFVEAQAIRADAATLPSGRAFLIAGDFNTQSSLQDAYQELVSASTPRDPSNRGRFFDPIATPGEWQNNIAYRFVHTQDPAPGAAGMDDRYDQILMSDDLFNTQGIDYIGQAGVPYSTVSWNDPRHSYRAWGNDGGSFNQPLRTVGNTMVGEQIALALQVMSNGAGHLPVSLDLRVPAKIASPQHIDAGRIEPGDTILLPVAHAGDIGRWGVRGLEALTLFSIGSDGATTPFGPFTVQPGEVISVPVTIDREPGPFSVSVLLPNNDPDDSAITVTITGTLAGACRVDVNGNGTLDPGDFTAWLVAYTQGDASADQNGDGRIDPSDFAAWVVAYNDGC
ncbi:MAG: GC-type dockerin domain-anchored protein [Phycisphaerales bacterium]